MTIKMLINAVETEEYRVAIIGDGILHGFHIETTAAEQVIGNIYKAVIERIEPSLQACFVNYGAEKSGFLSLPDVHPEYYLEGYIPKEDQGLPPINKVLKKGKELLVQVTKEMPGAKGAQLTTYLSLASRYVVLTPGRTVGGVSKKIEDEGERSRLKEIMAQFTLPEGVGYIVRTAAVKQSKRELSRDLNRLLRIWKGIKENVKKAPALSLVHKEQDLCLRTLRDYLTREIKEIIVDDKETFTKIKEHIRVISPWHQRRIKLYKDKSPIFDHYRVEEQIETIYGNRVELKSGGSIVIDPTEALISIDVNSGRGRTGKDIEATAFNTNREAAVEIARQLRLRDIGGLVVIDFIDMKDRSHNREIEKLLREETKEDRAKIDMSGISKFGLLELSRQRLRPSIESISYQVCRQCQGRGLVPSVESASLTLLRRIWVGASRGAVNQVKGLIPLDVSTYLQNKKRKELAELEARYGVEILLQTDLSLAPGEGSLEFVSEEAASRPAANLPKPLM
jgi:ribonuclease E